MRRQSVCFAHSAALVMFATALSACSSEGDNPPAAGTGGAGASAGVAAVSGTGSPVAGASVAGASGTLGAAGVGVAGTGAGVSGTGAGVGTAGAPVGAAGSGAAGTAAAPDALATCAGAATMPAAALHMAAAEALLPQGDLKGCAFSSCHDATAHKASFVLDGTMTNLKTLLVDKPSCQVPTLPLVASGGGDAALAKSWLWQKLTAPADSNGVLATKPEWGATVNCAQLPGQTYGLRMPWSNTPDLLKPPAKLEAIRSWICAGAPSP